MHKIWGEGSATADLSEIDPTKGLQLSTNQKETSALRIAVYSGAELLGDGLFKLPFVRSLKLNFPYADITWITTGATVYNSVLKDMANPYLTNIRENAGIGRKRLEILLPKKLDAGEFDITIDTQTVLLRSLAVRQTLKSKRFISATADYLLSSTKPRDIDKSWSRQHPIHLQDHLTRLIDLAARKKTDVDQSAIPVPSTFKDYAAQLLPDPYRYVGFAPGSGDLTKRWPLERFIHVARWVSEHGYKPVFFIGPNERTMLGTLHEALPDAIFPEENLPTDSHIKGPLFVAALGQRLSAALANDSGAGHILALSRIPLVLLYGRHSPIKYAPRTPYLRTVWARDFGGSTHEWIPVQRVTHALREALRVHPTRTSEAFSEGTKR